MYIFVQVLYRAVSFFVAPKSQTKLSPMPMPNSDVFYVMFATQSRKKRQDLKPACKETNSKIFQSSSEADKQLVLDSFFPKHFGKASLFKLIRNDQ